MTNMARQDHFTLVSKLILKCLFSLRKHLDMVRGHQYVYSVYSYPMFNQGIAYTVLNTLYKYAMFPYVALLQTIYFPFYTVLCYWKLQG